MAMPIQEEVALELLANRYKVYVTVRREQQLTDLIALGLSPLLLDVNDPAAINQAISQLENEQQQLDLFEVLKERKEKRDARTEFLRANRDTDTLKSIGIGEKQLQSLQISPDGRFVTYRLYQAPANNKSTIVPDYVTESGFTTDIPARTKVAALACEHDGPHR